MNEGESRDGVYAAAQHSRAPQAPVWVALGMHPNRPCQNGEGLIAFGSVVQNAHLMASALDLACKWTSGAVVMHDQVAHAVGFAPDTRLYGFSYVGRPAMAWPDGRCVEAGGGRR